MKKLGLDLGSSSLGWALRENNNIDKRGVITFKSGMVKGKGGGYSSPTKDRREARSKRRLIQARKYRKWELLEVLLNEFVPLDKQELENWSKYKKGQVQIFPENINFLQWLACDFTYLENGEKYKNPYELRVKALDNKLNKHEFGRALYHLVQRRGYRDIGETDSETENQIAIRGKSGFQKALEENRTIAEALTKEFLEKGERARNQYPYRNEYKEELLLICKVQECDNVLIQKLLKAIIWQRPLRGQKGNIGKCTLEPTKPRCPISHPIFEVYRAWGFINTIKYFDENGGKQSVSKEFRNELFELFLKKDKNFKFEEIRTFLDKQFKSKKKYNYPIDKKTEKYDTTVAGMPVCKGLIDIFGNELKEAIYSVHNYNIGNSPKIIQGYSLYDLWHILFEFDKIHLKGFAIEKLKLEDKVDKNGNRYNPFEKLKNSVLSGYADLSLKSMCKIIPFLKEGYLYNESAVLAKIPELIGEQWQLQKNKIFESISQSNKIYNWNKIINGITNNLIDRYKGLDNLEKFAHKDTQYIIDADDINDIEKACIGNFGEKSWKGRVDKGVILGEVKNQYQEFFKDSKRAFREVPLLTVIFKAILKENKIELSGNLYHHSNKENAYSKPIKDKKTGIEVLSEPKIDSIKNPMFNKSMGILRKLINRLILDGHIDEGTEIVIELARELNDNNKRAAIERYQNERKNNRIKYRDFLNEFNEKENKSINVDEGISTFELWAEQIFEETENEKKEKIFNKNNSEILREKEAIKRYELWREQKGQCMYTGKMISITRLFSNDIEIMHTIARSLLPDNTMANKTVGFKNYNTDLQKQKLPAQCDNYTKDVKGWGTAIEPRIDNWIQKRDSYKKLYEDRLKPKGNEDEANKNKRIQEKHYFKMHFDYWRDKVERFTTEEVKDGWARRQLVDTQMVSKYAREFLKTYFNKVAVQKGSVTADFRKIYSFQEEDEIKSRNKHTHHAIDAAVLTLIPVNSSHRDKLLYRMYETYEKEKRQYTTTPFSGFNAQRLIEDIDTNTLIVNYEKDNILKQTSKKIRNRGKLQYLKNKKGEFVLDKNKKQILKTAQGDSVRSALFKDTFIAKTRDVERYSNGQPIRENGDWKYKQGKDEFTYTVRKPIDEVLSKIEDIVDPVIKEIVKKEKNNKPIKDYQGNIIRHVRIKTRAGREVKERVNYRSQHEYKNKYYSASDSIPYAILAQRSDTGILGNKMIPITSIDVAKIYKELGKFDIELYIQKFHTGLKDYKKKLLKVGQKLIVLKNDNEYEKRVDIDFQVRRLYRITQFKYDGSKIILQYHLEAQGSKEIDNQVKTNKDLLVREKEMELGIPIIKENDDITDNVERKKDLKKRIEDFPSRLKVISDRASIETSDLIKKQIEEYKTESSNLDAGQPPILGLSKKNWNFLFEGEDFEISMLGKINWL